MAELRFPIGHHVARNDPPVELDDGEGKWACVVEEPRRPFSRGLLLRSRPTVADAVGPPQQQSVGKEVEEHNVEQPDLQLHDDHHRWQILRYVSHRIDYRGRDNMGAVHVRRIIGVEVPPEQLRRLGDADMGAGVWYLGGAMVQTPGSMPGLCSLWS